MAGKVTSMSTEARRKEQFNDTISNIRPVLTKGRGKSQKTITGSWKTYMRERTENRGRSLLSNSIMMNLP